jgi:hypothetical protein
LKKKHPKDEKLQRPHFSRRSSSPMSQEFSQKEVRGDEMVREILKQPSSEDLS